MQIRDRVKDFRRVRADQLRPHPRNWRTHPAGQRAALEGVLAEIGFAGALLARELPGGSLELIDGHLRAETAPEMAVPVLVLDVSEVEAELLLATFDPISALAERDAERLDQVLAQVQVDNPALRTMLEELSAEPEACQEDDSKREAVVPDVFQIVIECEDEAEQRGVYARLTADGLTCKLQNL